MDTNSSARARRTFFIDSENHINTCLQGIESLTERDLVVVFHRESNLSAKQKDAIKDSPARIEWILCQDSGVKNSLDVQLIAELSRRIACHEIENGYIVSQDQGYKPALHYLLNRYSDEFRFIGLKKSIDEFMLTDALISAESRQDVHEALVRHAGQIVGTAMYRHIRDLFDATDDSEEPEGGYSFADAPLFTEQSPDGSPQKQSNASANAQGANGANGSARKTSKRRKSRSGAKQTNSTPAGEGEQAAQHEPAKQEPKPQPANRTEGTDAPQIDSAPAQPSKPTRVKRVHGSAKQSAASTSDASEPSVASTAVIASKPSENAAETEHPKAQPQQKRTTRKPRAAKQAASEASTPAERSEQGGDRKRAANDQTNAKPAAKSAVREPKLTHSTASLMGLPGIGKALASRLESVGIASADELKSKGSRATWVLLKKQNPATSINWLYALEGAVMGIAVKELDEETKTSLKSFSKLAQ
ncbi:TfoX/Sxy family DNA transformation protein [Raoultibacter phocaeensis]|uniref:TfoX/Sxy family DNA transformation protein n=1 Tax=Raoultibacter phocaeensis TaxID=2479841 RepID=UPI0011191366|nr:TfoX/Sxy family DNA transformation protein [Raoultibacter phocaeensis]